MRDKNSTVIFSVGEPVYAEGAGILFSAGELVQNADGKQEIYLTLKSLCGVSPVGVTAFLRIFDGEGNKLGEYQYRYAAPMLLQDGSFGMGTPIVLPISGAASFSCYVRSVEWQGSAAKFFGEDDFKKLPAQQTLDEALSAEEADAYRKVYGKRAFYVPVRHGELDFCVCGAVFHISRRRVCPVCGATFVAHDEISPLDFENERIYREADAMPLNTPAACQKAAERFEAVAQYRDAQKRADACRERAKQLVIKKKKRKKTLLLSLIFGVGVPLLLAGAVLAFVLADRAARAGCRFALQEDGTYFVVGVDAGKEKLVIPSAYKDIAVTGIGAYAFEGCVELTQIEIPSTVTVIGEGAFKGCVELTDIEIPASVTTIGDSAFVRCRALESVNIPAALTALGTGVFRGCVSLERVYVEDLAAFMQLTFAVGTDNPLYYAKELYVDGEKVTNLVIPEGVTSIGRFDFYGCKALLSVTVPDGVTSIGMYAFAECANLSSATLAQSVTTIDGGAFRGCSALMNIKALGNVKTCGVGAFDGCAKLENATVSLAVLARLPKDSVKNVTLIKGLYIDQNAFAEFKNLETVVIGDDFTTVKYYAFKDCKTLTSVTFGKNVSTIDGQAFLGCTKLTAVVFPDSVKTIGYEAFSGCTNLTTVVIPSGVTQVSTDAFANCPIRDATFPLKALSSIPKEKLVNVVINGGTTALADSAFYGCDDLKTVTFTKGCRITKIGYQAFSQCDALESVNIPATVKTIDSYAFYSCPNLKTFSFDGTVSQWNGITKESFWNRGTFFAEVECSDGTTPCS